MSVARIQIIRDMRPTSTLQSIGDVLGITKERVRQLCVQYGIDGQVKHTPIDIPYKSRTLARLVSKSEEITSGCWVWQGSKTVHGYGRTGFKGYSEYVHRVAYELLRGYLPPGKYLRHRCKCRACWNPDHLYISNTWKTRRPLTET